MNFEGELQLRKVSSLTSIPLQLGDPIKFLDFMGCKFDFSEYYQTMANAVVVLFCCSSLAVCRKAAQYQRRRKVMKKGGKVVGRHMRPTTGSEMQHIASQYLMRTGADNYYVDGRRMERDQRRVLLSIANMAKGMLLPQKLDKLQQLKVKIHDRKNAQKR